MQSELLACLFMGPCYVVLAGPGWTPASASWNYRCGHLTSQPLTEGVGRGWWEVPKSSLRREEELQKAGCCGVSESALPASWLWSVCWPSELEPQLYWWCLKWVGFTLWESHSAPVSSLVLSMGELVLLCAKTADDQVPHKHVLFVEIGNRHPLFNT